MAVEYNSGSGVGEGGQGGQLPPPPTFESGGALSPHFLDMFAPYMKDNIS